MPRQQFSLNMIQHEKIDPDTDPDPEDTANRGRNRN
jgi:hypothetical protein